MSREIKFRAWDKTQNKIIYDFLMEGIKGFDKNRMAISFNGEIFYFTDWDMADYEEDEMFNSSCYVDRFELMQYTDLKDKNDKEIYEGDIIEGGYLNPLTNEFLSRKYLAEYKNGCFMGTLIGHTPYGDTWLSFIKGEIIGNIYEDKELLEVEHE